MPLLCSVFVSICFFACLFVCVCVCFLFKWVQCFLIEKKRKEDEKICQFVYFGLEEKPSFQIILVSFHFFFFFFFFFTLRLRRSIRLIFVLVGLCLAQVSPFHRYTISVMWHIKIQHSPTKYFSLYFPVRISSGQLRVPRKESVVLP